MNKIKEAELKSFSGTIREKPEFLAEKLMGQSRPIRIKLALIHESKFRLFPAACHSP